MTETPAQWAIDAVTSQSLAREMREQLPKEAAETAINALASAREQHESWEKRFGEMIRSWRHERGWSQEDVTERLRHQGFDMHQTTVAKIERGARPLRVAEAAALSEVFGRAPLTVFDEIQADDQQLNFRSRQRELDAAKQRSDEAKELLYSVAQRYAYLLAEVEKLILEMNRGDAVAQETDE